MLNNLKKSGFRIGAFGAPAMGNTLLNYYELNPQFIKCIADNTELKQNKITPGSHIPITSDEKFNEIGFDFALLLSWNYKDYFLKNSEYIKNGGKFIVPIPHPHVLPEK